MTTTDTATRLLLIKRIDLTSRANSDPFREPHGADVRSNTLVLLLVVGRERADCQLATEEIFTRIRSRVELWRVDEQFAGDAVHRTDGTKIPVEKVDVAYRHVADEDDGRSGQDAVISNRDEVEKVARGARSIEQVQRAAYKHFRGGKEPRDGTLPLSAATGTSKKARRRGRAHIPRLERHSPNARERVTERGYDFLVLLLRLVYRDAARSQFASEKTNMKSKNKEKLRIVTSSKDHTHKI